jgi:endoglycosylceramidase
MRRAAAGLLLVAACASRPAAAPTWAPVPAAITASPRKALHHDGRFFRDRAGRAVILRGVNLSANAKVPPFVPLDDLAELDRLPALGINLVRLLFIWEAYEPVHGQYDQRYLNTFTAIADAAFARGILVLVDIHQDGFSRFTFHGCGDGFPPWAVPPTLPLRRPDNGPQCTYWGFDSMTDPEIKRAFAAFYADDRGARSSYVQLLARLAAHFSSHPGVIGYDLLNEPPGREEAEVGELYRDAAAAVRSADPEALLFVEPDAARINLGIGPTRLPKPADGAVYAPHYYDWIVMIWNQWSGTHFEINRSFELMASDARRWGSPLFIGELGISATAVNAAEYMRAVYDRLDAELGSCAQWAYSPHWSPVAKDGWNREDFGIVDQQGKPRRNFRVRPYAQRIAGTPLQMRVVGDHGLFVRWRNDGAAPGAAPPDTELFAPRALFRHPPLVVASPADLSCAYAPDELVFRCHSASAGEASVMISE